MEDFIVFESDSDNDDDDYGQTFTTHLSKVELNEQLSTTLESIISSNSKNRISHFIKLSNLLLLFGNRLGDNQLRNVLRTVGINVTYDDHKMATDIELELHLRAYVLALETYGKHLVTMENELLKTLHENLAKLYNFHQHYIRVIKKGLQGASVLSATLDKAAKVQNYNNEFLFMHLYNTLHVMDDDDTVWLEIIGQLKAFFATLIEALPNTNVTGVMATMETSIDNKFTAEIYNIIQGVVQSKFSAGHWYKEWRYLYTIYQAFVEWSAAPIIEIWLLKEN